MMVRKRKGLMWVPYGHLISKVLEYIGFNVNDEESVDNSTGI